MQANLCNQAKQYYDLNHFGYFVVYGQMNHEKWDLWADWEVDDGQYAQFLDEHQVDRFDPDRFFVWITSGLPTPPGLYRLTLPCVIWHNMLSAIEPSDLSKVNALPTQVST